MTHAQDSIIPTSDAPNAAEPLVGRIVSALSAVRRRARVLLVIQRAGWIVALALLALFVGGTLDYFLRAPSSLRLAGLLGAIALLAFAIWRRVIPALRFNPSLTEIALRVERAKATTASTIPENALSGVLASGLELGQVGDAEQSPVERRLALPVVERAARAAEAVRVSSLLKPAAALVAAVASIVAIFASISFSAAEPELSRIGLNRMLLPWTNVDWPKRTGVADATNLRHHPLGTALSLRAALTKSDSSPDKTPVAATYRVRVNGVAGPSRRVVLTNQSKLITTTDRDAQSVSGTLFERLLEPSAFGAETSTKDPSKPKAQSPTMVLEYQLSTDDDETPTQAITLVEPPAIINASARIDLPEYAMKALGMERSDPLPIDLGSGSDERSAPAPILAGSLVSLSITLNKSLPVPTQLDNDWLTRSFGPDFATLFSAADPRAPISFSSTPNSNVWTLTWRHLRSVRLALHPVDEHGIGAGEESVFRFDVLSDAPPTATVITPTEDKSVLPTAIVELAAEGRDDIALSEVSLDRQIARRAKGSESKAVEPLDTPTTIVSQRSEVLADPSQPRTATKRLVAQTSLDLSTLSVQPGDEVWITGVATDAYELDAQRHAPVRSSIRKLRIMSRDELVEQIWSELSAVRKSAIRLDQDQVEAAKTSAQPGEESARRAERAQAGLTERLSRQSETLKRLQQRVTENSLSDATVNQVLRQASESLERAGKQSAEAAKAMTQAAQSESQESPDTKAASEQREKAAQDQQGVREELANLVDLLDQGEDTFASKRSLERLLEQQKALQERTRETGQRTTGRDEQSLEAKDRAELDQISQDQKALAEQLKDAVRKMQEREQKLSKSDPAAAQAMAQAARRAEREQVAEKMQQAAQQAQQNQTNNAQQQQQQAAQALEQMLKELEKANTNRDEVLRRQLASLIESIEGLIRQQTIELSELTKRSTAPTPDLTGLDSGMVRLHQNTLGVLEEASNAPREAAAVVAPITRASEAQAKSIPALRTKPVVAENAQKLEQESLDQLNEALKLAQNADKQAEDRQNSRKRAELRGKYEEALKQQLSIKDSVEGLAAQQQGRRTQAAARLAGQEQQALRDQLSTLRQETKEVASAKVFDFAHTRLDKLMSDAATALADGTADANILRQQTSAARVLRSMVESLQDAKKDKDPFRKPEGSGGGSGSGKPPPLLPPAAEVRLLRSMQQEAADLTRSAAEGNAPDARALAEAAALQQDIAKQGADLLKRAAEQASGQPKANMPEIKPVEPEPALKPEDPKP